MAVLKFRFVPAIRYNLFVAPHNTIVIARRNDEAIFYSKCKQKGFSLLSGLKNNGNCNKQRLQDAIGIMLLCLAFRLTSAPSSLHLCSTLIYKFW
jgi:hypothetical protein